MNSSHLLLLLPPLLHCSWCDEFILDSDHGNSLSILRTPIQVTTILYIHCTSCTCRSSRETHTVDSGYLHSFPTPGCPVCMLCTKLLIDCDRLEAGKGTTCKKGRRAGCRPCGCCGLMTSSSFPKDTYLSVALFWQPNPKSPHHSDPWDRCLVIFCVTVAQKYSSSYQDILR